MRSTPPFHLIRLIHLIDKPYSNADSFDGGFAINESRESSEAADVMSWSAIAAAPLIMV